MDVTGIAALSSEMAASRTREAVGVTVLKRALDVQQQGALALLAALPKPVPAANPSHLGNRIDTFA